MVEPARGSTSGERAGTAPGEPGERVVLILDAGGARSAYQVGALEVLLPALAEQGLRPDVLVGTSAGGLLSAALTSTAHLDADEQVRRLSALLRAATKKHVIRPLWRQVPVVALQYASETIGSQLFRLRGIFGTKPLSATLAREIDWDQLHANIADGTVAATSICATAVRTGRVTMFTETGPGWSGSLPEPDGDKHRAYVHARLDVEHLMASAAIPALFPSVLVHEPDEVAGWYVDGATRRRVPLAPAIELAADRVVVVGTGSIHPAAPDAARDRAAVDLGDAAATLLGAVMDDPLRHDLRRFAEVNAMAGDPRIGPALAERRQEWGRRPHRQIPYVGVAPQQSEELAEVALEVYRRNHGNLRSSMSDPDLQIVHRLLGSDSPLQGELLSYLLFDRDFFDEAGALGRRDAQAWLDHQPGLWATGPPEPLGVSR